MILLEFRQAVAVYVLIFIVFFVGGGIFSLLGKKEKRHKDILTLYQCSICTIVYTGVADKEMTICPRCGSYNQKEVSA